MTIHGCYPSVSWSRKSPWISYSVGESRFSIKRCRVPVKEEGPFPGGSSLLSLSVPREIRVIPGALVFFRNLVLYDLLFRRIKRKKEGNRLKIKYSYFLRGHHD